jgi:hypothetical protein
MSMLEITQVYESKHRKSVPYTLVNVASLYKLFLECEKFIPYFSDKHSTKMFYLCELAADIHKAYNEKDYDMFRWLFIFFIDIGRF